MGTVCVARKGGTKGAHRAAQKRSRSDEVLSGTSMKGVCFNKTPFWQG